jgi:hypothetical protein
MRTPHIAAPLIALVLLAAAPAAGAAATDDAGRVLAVRRDAVVVRQAQNLAARPEMPLLLDDAVATGEQARAKLFFRDDSVLNLGEKSRVQVKEYLFSPEKNRSKSIFQLLDGSLKVVVGRSDLEVHTSSAVAAARGTSFFIWSEPGAGSRSCLMVLDGTVALRNRDEKIPGEVLVGAGQMSCVPFAAAPGAAGALDAELLRRLSAATFVLSPGERGPLGDLPPTFFAGSGAGDAAALAVVPPETQQPATGVEPPAPLPPLPPPPGPPGPPPPVPVPPPEEQQRRAAP